MKTRLFCLLCLMPGVLLAQKGVLESDLPGNPIVVDGKVDEWQGDWKLDPKGKFLYNIANDEDNLYMRIKIADEMTQRKIGLFGFTVWLNPSGKKVGKLGLKYPVAKDMEELKRTAPKGEVTAQESERLKDELINEDQVQVLELFGLAKESIVSSRLGLLNGIQVFIAPGEHHEWLYEAKIPFKAFQIDKSKVKLLGITFQTGKLVVTNTTQPNMTGGGGPGNIGYANRYGMGSGYGGGYGGGGYGRQSSGPRYSDWNISTNLQLSVKLK